MLDLDSNRWSQLRHAYGFADDVPQMLRDLAKEPNHEAWDRIWSALCHQSTVYSASYAAVPHIVATAERQSPKDQAMFWAFVGAVAAYGSKYFGEPPDEFREPYLKANARSASLIVQLLKGRPESETDVIYLLGSLAAVRGCMGPGRILDHLVDGEFPGRCPACEEELYVSLHEEGIFLTCQDPVAQPASDKTWVEAPGKVPASKGLSLDECTPSNSQEWLPRWAEEAGHPKVAENLRRLYGTALCPACKHRFPLMEELYRQAEE
jgi:uncharacterized protein YbaR (Trm112 family)